MEPNIGFEPMMFVFQFTKLVLSTTKRIRLGIAGGGFEPPSQGYEPCKKTTSPSRDNFIICDHTRFLFSKTYSKASLLSMFGSCFSDKLIIELSFNNGLLSPQAFDSKFSFESVSAEPAVLFIS